MARQILPIAGAIIGGAFGAPQLGFAIGSIIGNAVDPLKVQGPKVGDLQIQTSRDGVPRPVVYGVACVAGNIIDRTNPRIVKKKERAGKGGPVTITERAYLSFAIRICEGPAVGISRVWENEKLVYDVTPGSTIPNDSAKFAAQVTFYLGDETQMPDPTLEAHHGVGFTPAHRGTCYAVFKDKDVTDTGGAIPQYRFEIDGSAPVASPSALALLHFDGTNGSTTYTDEYGNTWASTGSYSPQTLSTAEAGFGDSSLRSIYYVDSGMLSTSITGVDASSDLTVDFWYYYAYTEGTLDKFYGLHIVQFYLNDRDYKLQTTSYGGAYQLVEFGESISDNSAFSVLQDSWNHFRIVRVGGTVTLSINGAVAITLTGTAGSAGTYTLGIDIGNTGVNQLEGYIDEFYVTAEALPTTFTPPVAPWPNP